MIARFGFERSHRRTAKTLVPATIAAIAVVIFRAIRAPIARMNGVGPVVIEAGTTMA
jgi:hypothetical protein